MPATSLQGLVTASGWSIDKLLTNGSGSGGNFCTQYEATSPAGKKGFLKAMDLSRAFSSPDPIKALNVITSEYLFEQEILEHCKDQKLSKVVVPLDSGRINNPQHHAPYNQVFYIIFEFAEGDLRGEYLNKKVSSWRSAFKSLHHVGIGIKQLHNIGIAHQDIKPSNILCFPNEESKVSDLGRVTDDKGRSPFSQYPFTGDRTYAPLEISYPNILHTDFIDRRHSDLYMYGSLIYHVISGLQLTSVLRRETLKLMPNFQMATYKDALPFINSAFTQVMDVFYNRCVSIFDEDVAKELYEIVSELCYPDYERRGNSKYTNKLQRLSLEKYISKMSSVQRKLYIKGIK
ncbi:TPA: protein kinase [Vibrio vulnificus]